METIAMRTLNFRLEKNPDGLVLTKIKRESEIINKQYIFALPINIEPIKTEFIEPVSNQSKILPKKTVVVTGVSRSGRVMKKSSKLLDFEIPRYKHRFPKRSQGRRHTSSIKQINASKSRTLPTNFEMIKTEPVDMGDDSSSCEENFSDDEAWNYLEEKSTTKNIVSNGKMMTKERRRDKGQSRFTGYMVWSKAVRQQLLSENPNLDFPSTSRKLAQLWAEVPTNQKYNWRRKAKRLTSKLNQTKAIETVWITGDK